MEAIDLISENEDEDLNIPISQLLHRKPQKKIIRTDDEDEDLNIPISQLLHRKPQKKIIRTVVDDEDDDLNITLADLMRREDAKERAVAQAAQEAARRRQIELERAEAEVLRAAKLRREQDEARRRQIELERAQEEVLRAAQLRREQEAARQRQIELERAQEEQRQMQMKREREKAEKEDQLRRIREENAARERQMYVQMQREKEEAERMERMRRAQEEEAARQLQRNRAQAEKAERELRERERTSAVSIENAPQSADSAKRYRELRLQIIKGNISPEAAARELRQLRQVLAAQGRSPSRSPRRAADVALTADEKAYLGQFPVWGHTVKHASPRMKYELLMRKKDREHEFLKRTLALENRGHPRGKTAIAVIMMHGGFSTNVFTPIPPGMIVTRGSLSSPGALRFGDEEQCAPVETKWESRVIKKGLQTYKTLFPDDREILNPADFMNIIEAEMNAGCVENYQHLIEMSGRLGKNAFCTEHVGLQYMMYSGEQKMAFKNFGRRQTAREHHFNVYVTDMSGTTTKLFPDKPLALRTSSTEILKLLAQKGFTNVIIIDLSCQSFSMMSKEQQRETAAAFGKQFLLGGGGYTNDIFGLRSIEQM